MIELDETVVVELGFQPDDKPVPITIYEVTIEKDHYEQQVKGHEHLLWALLAFEDHPSFMKIRRLNMVYLRPESVIIDLVDSYLLHGLKEILGDEKDQDYYESYKFTAKVKEPITA